MTEPPVRTPAGSAKSLQLTPIWEEVVKNQRVPPDIAVTEILREIRGRLRAGEWEVRQHALRVLADVLPVTGEPVESSELQAALIVNLGSPAPGVRKAAREALGRLLQLVKNSEEEILELLGGCNDENVTLGIIIAIPDILKPFIFPENGGYVLSSSCLTAILTYLVNKVSTPIYRDASIESLLKIRELCGEMKFQKCLENISPDIKTLKLLALNLDDSGVDFKIPQPDDSKWSDYALEDEAEFKTLDLGWSDNSDSEQIQKPKVSHGNSGQLEREVTSDEGGSDGSDGTYTKDPIDPGKVVLETEIQLSEQRALTMRIMERDSLDTEDGVMFDSPDGRFVSADGSLVMAVIPSSDDEGVRRTPRRVRFGGEVVKLCTPDSDATDVRIEIQGSSGHAVDRLVIERISKSSQIPLPITPATSRPQAPIASPRLRKSLSVDSFNLENTGSELLFTSNSSESLITSPHTSPPLIEVTAPNSSSFETDASEPISMEPRNSTNVLPLATGFFTDPANSNSSSSPDASEPEFSSKPKEEILERPKSATKRVPLESFNSVDATIPEFSTELWSWQTLGFLDEESLTTLQSNSDWKEELKILELLRKNLMTTDAKNKFGTADPGTVKALVQYLVNYCKPQTAEAALLAVGQILQSVPKPTTQICLEDVVAGLCKHVGSSSSVSTKLASADVIRFLFTNFTPEDILEILLGQRCLHSPSSKMRENALITLLHVLMTYPSTMFSQTRLLEESCRSLADPRRRVRHAALETLAVLAQFSPTSKIIDCVSKFGDTRLVSAVSARLARRSLPSVSPDGLVLYALQIPSARRLGRTGPPEGADVDWILSGTGSLSTGSARSRGQMQTTRWAADNNVVRKASRENPWTAQKHRTEDALSWALVPVSGLDEGVYGGTEGGYLSGVRPLYVKLAAPEDALRSHRYAVHRVADTSTAGAPIRVLTPSVLRKPSDSKPSPWTENSKRENEADHRRLERMVGRKVVEAPRPIFVTTSPISHISTPPAAVILPSILDKPRAIDNSLRLQHLQSAALSDKPRFAEIKSEAPTEELHNGTAILPTVSNRTLASASAVRPPPVEMEQVIPLPVQADSPEKLFQRTRRESRDLGLETRVSMASAPPAISSREREMSSSSSTSGSQPPLINGETGPLEVSYSISYKSLNENFNQKVKAKRRAVGCSGVSSKGSVASGQHFPPALKPFDRPKEGLDTCLSQLDSQQWEVTMQGLASLVRLVRHHPNNVAAHMHSLAAALARQIRNLRSQVARAACQACGEIFTTLKRQVEPELEELASALFHRAADTNRFIRADSNAALDAMVESIAPSKAVNIILSKGMSHPNAVVKTTAGRLLLLMSEKLGPQKILSLSRDTRDRMLQAGANLLTEGRLETRSYAKQLFRVWSLHPEFPAIIVEAIPANVMRNIAKILATLKG